MPTRFSNAAATGAAGARAELRGVPKNPAAVLAGRPLFLASVSACGHQSTVDRPTTLVAAWQSLTDAQKQAAAQRKTAAVVLRHPPAAPPLAPAAPVAAAGY